MDISEMIVSYNSIKMEVRFAIKDSEMMSPIYKIHFIEYRTKAFLNVNRSNCYLLIKLEKCVDDDILYNFEVSSTKLKLRKLFISDDSDWRVLGVYGTQNNGFHYVVDIEVKVDVKTFKHMRLSDHDSSTIFEVKGIDGSIHVHDNVLAAASEVFRQMITSDFIEKKESRIELPYSICVLQDFKDYLYFNTLKNDNLENLLMLAHCYMMYDLKRICIHMLFFNTISETQLKNVQEKEGYGGEKEIKE